MFKRPTISSCRYALRSAIPQSTINSWRDQRSIYLTVTWLRPLIPPSPTLRFYDYTKITKLIKCDQPISRLLDTTFPLFEHNHSTLSKSILRVVSYGTFKPLRPITELTSFSVKICDISLMAVTAGWLFWKRSKISSRIWKFKDQRSDVEANKD